MKKVILPSLGALFLCVFCAQMLQAKVQVGAYGTVGLFGEINYETEWEGGSADYDENLELNPGFGLYGEIPFAFEDQLIIGGETRFLWVEAEHGVNKDLFWDLGVYIKFSYNIVSYLNLYVRVAPGFSVYFPEDNRFDNGFGFNFGVFAGPELKFNEMFGLFTEVGFIYHKIYGDGEIASNVDMDYEIDTMQLHINLGLYAKF